MKLLYFDRLSRVVVPAALVLACLFALAVQQSWAAAPGGTGPAVGSSTMPEGQLRLVSGPSFRNFEVVRDRIYIKPRGAVGEFREIPEMLSNASLQAYVHAEELISNHELIGFVLKRPGSEFQQATARVLTRKLGVQLIDGSHDAPTANAVAADLNLEWMREEVGAEGWTIYRAASAATILDTVERLIDHDAVVDAYAMVGWVPQKKICEGSTLSPFFPTDPFWVADDPDFMGYMNPPPDPPNDADPINNGWLIDINQRPVWENAAPFFPPLVLDPFGLIEPGTPFLKRPYTGNGIIIAIADDGLDHEHEDLKLNVSKPRQNDWVEDDSDPGDGAGQHGTNVAGIIAMEANRVGGVGIAARSTIAGLRFLDAPIVDDELEEKVFEYRGGAFDIHHNSWGVPDNVPDGDGPGRFAAAALKKGAELSDKIYVFANGNGGPADNSNHDGYPASMYTIAVGSVDFIGLPTSYTEDGSNVLVVAPGSDGDGPQLMSTDLGDTYITNGLDGTSFSCPMVSGIVALMLQANPDLSWRDVQEILIASSAGFGRSNGGIPSPLVTDIFPFGYRWDHAAEIIGYGLVSGADAVHMAEQWPLLPDGANYKKRTKFVRVNDPIDETVSFEFDFSDFANLRVEHVEVLLEWEVGSDPAPATVGLVAPTFAWGGGEYWSALSLGEATLMETQLLTSVGHWGQESATGAMEGLWRVDIGGAGGRELERVTVCLYGVPVNTVPIIENATLTSSGDPTAVNPREITDTEDLIITDIQVRDEDREDPVINFQLEELSADGVTWLDVPGAGSGTMVTGGCQWAPISSFTIEPISPRFGEEVVFTDTSTDQDGTVVGWEWDFGTGDTSTDQNPAYTFAGPGDFPVSLTVTDDTGRTDTFAYFFNVRGFSQDPPDPLPVIPPNPGDPVCDIVNDLVFPASLTKEGTLYRVTLTARDDLQDGVGFTTDPVIVNSAPVTLACAGELYVYDSTLWVNNLPPAFFPNFANVNEVSQGVLGNTSNGEWVELLVSVGSDFRGFHLTNDIVTFDMEFTQNELWAAVPAGTLIVIYNGDFRDTTLPADDTDLTDGVIVVSSNNGALFTLPSNGDAWGEVSNGNPAHIALQDEFCRPIHGVSWDGDTAYVVLPQSMPDGTSAHYSGTTLADYDTPAFWVVGTAAPVDPALSAPFDPGTPGVTPGAVNDSANMTVQDDIIAAGLTSIATYSVSGPAWLSINPGTGVLSGTPTVADAGVFPVTITFEHSFWTEEQTFDLIVKPGPPLPPLGDLDNDLIVNMLEEAFATDTGVATAHTDGLPVVGVTTVPGLPPTNHLSISFRVPAGAVFDPATQTYSWTSLFGVTYLYEVQCSNDLMTWANAGDLGGALFEESSAPIAGDPLGASLSTFRSSGEFPGGPDGRWKFLRVKVTIVP